MFVKEGTAVGFKRETNRIAAMFRKRCGIAMGVAIVATGLLFVTLSRQSISAEWRGGGGGNERPQGGTRDGSFAASKAPLLTETTDEPTTASPPKDAAATPTPQSASPVITAGKTPAGKRHSGSVRLNSPARPEGSQDDVAVAVNAGQLSKVIWVFWEYPDSSPPNAMVRLDLETWRRALPGWTLRLVNDSNIGEFVPDLPDEYYRLPYTQVKSDVLRAAVLYHHGGLYLDTDFVVSPRIAEAVELVEAKTADVVTYGNGKEHICDTSHFSAFASNFMCVA